MQVSNQVTKEGVTATVTMSVIVFICMSVSNDVVFFKRSLAWEIWVGHASSS